MKTFFKNLTKEWKSTLIGLTSIILLVLLNGGAINLEQKENYYNVVNLLIGNLDGVIALIVSLFMLGAKDFKLNE